MSRYRIVIRAFTCRRDIAPMEILKRLLEKRGCQVILANTRNFDFTVKYWKPDAIVVNTLGDTMIKRKSPQSKTIFLSGEGFHGPNDSHAKIWKERKEFFDNMDMGLLWGEKVKQECKETLDESYDITKLHVVGNPKMDLVKFLPNYLKDAKIESVGFIGRFLKLNDHLGRPAIRNLFSEFHLQEALVQCKSAYAMIASARKILEETNLRISIRPHPHEQIESYEDCISAWFKKEHLDRIDVDTSLFLPTWLARQKAILSPTSTSFLEAYVLGVPVINLDFISGIEEFNQDYISFTKEWQHAAIKPRTVEELISILKDEESIDVQKDETIERQLRDFGIPGATSSACLNAAKCILSCIKNDPPKRRTHAPFPLVDLWDEISFRRNQRWNKLHQNFCYRRGYHVIPNYVNEIVNNIEEAANIRQKET